jgi:hypothetical protein
VLGLGLDLAAALQASGAHWGTDPLKLGANPVADLRAAAGRAGSTDLIVLGLVSGRLQAYRLRLRSGSELSTGRGRLDTLAVTLLHERLLRDCWGLDLEKPEESLRFTRSLDEAVEAVRSGACSLAVLPPPEPVSAVLQVAEQGHIMPQKATYFVPKLRSGVVLGPLDEARPAPWRDVAGDGGRPDTRLPRV